MSKNLGTLTLDMLVNLTGFKRGMQDAEHQTQSSTKKMVQHFDVVSQSSRDLGENIGRLLSISSGLSTAFSVPTLMQSADAYTQLSNKLNLVVNSEKELQTALDDTFKIAQETAATWSSVNEIYTKFAQNSDKLNLSQKQVASITQTVAKAVGMSGASAASADAALMQFGQALNTGVLRGAELNSVMSQTPALAKAIAEGMNVAVGDLKKLGEEGQITTEVMIDALQRVAPQVEAEYAKTTTSISESLNRVQNQFIKMVGEMNSSLGISDQVVSAITLISSEMDKLMIVAGGIATVMTGRYVASMVQATQAVWAKVQATRQEQLANVQRLGELALEEKRRTAVMAMQIRQAQQDKINAITIETQRIATDKLRVAQLEYEIQLRSSTQATNAYATAQKQATLSTSLMNASKNSLLGLLGGPVGLAATIATVASGYFLLQNNAKQATIELDTQSKTVTQLVDEFEKLADSQKRQAIQQQIEKISKYTQELKDNQAALMGVVREIQRKNEVTGQDNVILDTALRNYRQGKIDIETFGNTVADLTYKSEEWKNKLNEQVVATSKATEQVNFSNDVLNHYNQSAQQATNRSQTFNHTLADTANRAKEAKSQLESLNNEAKNYLNSLNSAQKLAYVQTNMRYGWSQDKASFMYEARKKLGISDNERLSDEVKQRLETEYESAQKLSAMASSSRQVTFKKNSINSQKAKLQNFGSSIEKQRERLIQDQLKSRTEISQQYTSDYQKIIFAEAEQLKRLSEAGFSQVDEEKYKTLIRQRFAYEQAEYLKNLNLQINQHRWSEREKLDYSYEMDKELITNDIRLHDDVKQVKLKALNEQYQYELTQIQLNHQKRYTQASQFLHNEKQLVRQRYELERAEIALTADARERWRLTAISKAQERDDLINQYLQTNMDYAKIESQMNGKEYDNPIQMSRYNRTEALDKKYGATVDLSHFREQENLEQLQQFREQQLISEYDFERQKTEIMRQGLIEREQAYIDFEKNYAQIEKLYHHESIQGYLNYAQQVNSAMMGLASSMMGEGSKAYKTMFAMQKAFAISQASINIYKAASDAWGDPSATSIYQKMANAALAVAKSSQFVTLINAINPKGFATGGYTGNIGRNQIAGVVHGQEYVLNAQATQRIGVNNLNRLNRGESMSNGDTLVNVNVVVNTDNSSSVNSNEQFGQAMGEAIKNAVLKIIQQEKRQGGMLA